MQTGADKWRYYTIDAVQPLNGAFGPNFVYGPSGADVWGQPTYDEASNTVYFGTGQNFSPKLSATPPFSTGTSDAIIAVDATTGALKWKHQFTAGDVWVSGLPLPNPINPETGLPQVSFAKAGFLDLDFGDAPHIYRLGNGRKVIGAGQKSGEFHVLDAATGEVLTSTMHIGMANGLGGFQSGGAFANNTVFQHGLRALDETGAGPYLGTVLGLSPDGTEIKWEFDHLLSPFAAPIAVGDGVVYAVSPADEVAALNPSLPKEWAIYGIDARNGAVLFRKGFPGRALSGVAVDNERVYVGMGNSAIPQIGFDFNGGIVSLGPSED